MSGHIEWHGIAMKEAMDQALRKVDAHVLEAPRACSHAVSELVGDRCWGAFLFDQAPLIRVYLDSVWRLDALGLIDSGRELRELLDGCVASAKQNEHPAFVHSVGHVNPVEYLAGLLGAHVGVYLQTYEEVYKSEAEDAALQAAYAKAYPAETSAQKDTGGQDHAGESN
jgi:hypothetical protein